MKRKRKYCGQGSPFMSRSYRLANYLQASIVEILAHVDHFKYF